MVDALAAQWAEEMVQPKESPKAGGTVDLWALSTVAVLALRTVEAMALK